MTARDWTRPEGRAELWRLLDGPGWPVGTLQMGSGSPARAGLEAAMGAALPLLDALEAAERERDSIRTERNMLRDRLQFDPGGSDKIDELEAALEFTRHAEMCLRTSAVELASHLLAVKEDHARMRAVLEAAEAREAKLRAALRDVPNMEHDCFEQDCPQCSCAAGIRAALALPTDRTALDALLAEARREGAQACVEAARAALLRAADPGLFHAQSVARAVEHAAAEIEAAARKEPTP